MVNGSIRTCNIALGRLLPGRALVLQLFACRSRKRKGSAHAPAAGRWEPRKQGASAGGKGWMLPVRVDLEQGYEHECAPINLGVGQDQAPGRRARKTAPGP